MNLPKNNKYEDDETISKRKLTELLPPDRFEIQKEDKKDRGIDIHVELKLTTDDGDIVHSNFRFIIQLKTNDGKKNNKDQHTLAIDSSNINYLLNDAMPAYYVLYHLSEKQLYYVKLTDFVSVINSNGKNIDDQKTHTLHFDKLLTSSIIDDFFSETLKQGQFLRKLKEEGLRTGEMRVNNDLIVTNNYDLTSMHDLIYFVENQGAYLINQGRWKEVLLVHRKLPSGTESSSSYDLIVGISLYYTGEIFNSVSFFKNAIRKGNLVDDRKDYAEYFLSLSKYSLGIIDKCEHESVLSKIMTSEELKFLIEIERMGAEIFNNDSNNFRIELEEYTDYLARIVSNEAFPEQVLDIAKCEWIKFEGLRINSDYLTGLNTLQIPVLLLDDEYRKSIGEDILNKRKEWFNKSQKILNDLLNRKKHFSYCLCLLNTAKATYQFTVFSAHAKYMRTDNIDDSRSEESRKTTLSLLPMIDDAYRYFRSVNHIDNVCVSLSLKYEIFHFSDRTKECEEIITEFKKIATIYDIETQELKFKSMIDGETAHERNIKIIQAKNDLKTENHNRHETLVAAMKEMDIEESKKKDDTDRSEFYQIELFPIQNFEFPKERTSEVFQILKIIKTRHPQFESMWELGVVPIANVFLNPIEYEGRGNGKEEDQGITSWENIFRIRKAFFEKGFKRVQDN